MDGKSIIIALLLLSGGVTAFLSLYAIRWRHNNGALAFILLMTAVTFYSCGYALELHSTELPGMALAVRIEYIGIAFLAPLWLILALQYTGHDGRMTLPAYLLIFLIPAATLIINYTNDLHHLYYRQLGVNTEGPFPVLAMVKGPWYYVNLAYLNLSVLAGNALYIHRMVRSSGPYRKQAAVMMAASLLPWVGNTVYQLGLSPYGIDLNPYALTSTGPIFALALFRYRVFDLVPIARDAIFEGMGDPVIVLDSRNRVADFNAAAAGVFAGLNRETIGSDAAVILGDHPSLLRHADDAGAGRPEIRIGNGGATRHYQSQRSPIRDRRRRTLGTIITLQDITEKTELLAKLNHLATVDELTGVFNRRRFMDLCAGEINRARRYGRACSFVIMDLDNFKMVNDTYGHQAGDMALEYAAALCSNTLRQCDIFGRYGGEEFAILLPETPPASAMVISRRLRDALAGSPFLIGDREIAITASFGVTGAESIDANVNLDSLIAKADEALYRAKAGGRNRVEQA